MANHKLILVTGATGYVGGQLIPRLLEDGYDVRAMVRNPEKLHAFAWREKVQIAVADALKPETLAPALVDVHAAYYLVHSMTGGSDFARQDILAARNFGQAAQNAGVERVIYLGGLGDPAAELSKHLRSRHETGQALRESGVRLTEFRAAVVVGAGSISFEMIRHLTERIPVMICPRWVRTKTQPIAIEDVISYLVTSLRRPESADQIIEIGGTDVFTYGDMMKGYARERGLYRLLLNVPVLTPRLSSYWVHWVTPISAAYARPLIEGLRNEVVVTDEKASQIFPEVKPCRYAQAVRRALSQLAPEHFEDPADESDPGEEPGVLVSSKSARRGMIVENRHMVVRSGVKAVYDAFTALGGPNGWPCNAAWRLRAALDRVLGGVGMRRGSPGSDKVTLGDTIDFFRVVKIEPGRMIRLQAEMKLPGAGWLQFEAQPLEADLTRLVQRVFFAPRGLLGIIYWYLLYPVHRIIFLRMIKKIASEAER